MAAHALFKSNACVIHTGPVASSPRTELRRDRDARTDSYAPAQPDHEGVVRLASRRGLYVRMVNPYRFDVQRRTLVESP